MRYLDDILHAIGNTPLVRMSRLSHGLDPLVLAKMEMFNPGGSSKDRVGLKMIDAAERLGLLRPGGTIVEPTSGNTGIGLAQVAVVRGYSVIFTMNDKVCKEKRNILRAYGAKLVICPYNIEPDDPRSYYKVAERLTREIPNSFCPNQYANEDNPLAHYETTGPEIWRDTMGKVTHFVAGMGTGGTISGTARYLKEQNPSVRVIGVDAKGSIYRHLYDGVDGRAESYRIEGIGQDFLPGTIDLSLIDEVVTVDDEEAYRTAREVTRNEAWMVGSSGGAVVAGALRVASRASKDAVVVMLVPDSGKNYLSTVFNDCWMEENGLI